jgi:hypothetical protein
MHMYEICLITLLNTNVSIIVVTTIRVALQEY